MKYLDSNGLQYLFNKLQSNLKVVEDKYVYTTSTTEKPSFSIPNFNSNYEVDVYLNRLILIPQQDYTLSNSGVITFFYDIIANQTIYVVVRKVQLRGV